jgi:hypothetical protein
MYVETAGGLAQPRDRVPPIVRHFDCSAPALFRISLILRRPPNRPVNGEELQSAVGVVARRAISWALEAARALEVPPEKRTDSTRSAFRAAFGTSPEFVPTWRRPTDSWGDLGQLVAIRLRNVAKELDSGSIRYFCEIDPANCPECTPPVNPNDFACSSFALRHVICLGPAFWNAMRDANDLALPARDRRRARVEMTLTLLHEPLHIYYGQRIGDGGGRTRFNNAFCYERFVVRVNGQPLPPEVNRSCA